jgi:hypothetical protein
LLRYSRNVSVLRFSRSVSVSRDSTEVLVSFLTFSRSALVFRFDTCIS